MGYEIILKEEKTDMLFLAGIDLNVPIEEMMKNLTPEDEIYGQVKNMERMIYRFCEKEGCTENFSQISKEILKEFLQTVQIVVVSVKDNYAVDLINNKRISLNKLIYPKHFLEYYSDEEIKFVKISERGFIQTAIRVDSAPLYKYGDDLFKKINYNGN